MKADRNCCPSLDELKAFTLGKESTSTIEVVGRHLEECRSCVDSIEQIHADSDSFLDYLKGNLEEESPLSEGKTVLQNLTKRLRELPHKFSSASQSTPYSASGEEAHKINEHPIPKRLGQYRLLEMLGRGGMSIVYKAKHDKLKRHVAVKILLPKSLNDKAAIARFEMEMEAIGRIDEHPNIVRAHDAGEINGHHFLVMDYVDGVDASQLVCRLGRLSAADACEIVRQAALGLEYAHQHHIVHRDVKPANIILTKAGEVKLLDMGLAVMRENTNSDIISAADMIVGTADYISPEQWQDSSQADTRSDIYSLGCTLFKFLIGYAPFSQGNDDPRKKMKAHLKAPYTSVCAIRPTLPTELGEVVGRMLAKDPDDRYSNPGEVAIVMEQFNAKANLRDLVGRAYVPTSDTQSKAIDATMAMRSMLYSIQQRVKHKKVWLTSVLIVLLLITATTLGTFLRSSKEYDDLNLLFPDQRQYVLYQEDRSHNSVDIQTEKRSFFVVGKANNENYSFSTNIGQKSWQGETGIYLGHNAIEHQGETTHSLEIIELRKLGGDVEKNAFEIVRSAVSIYEKAGKERIWRVSPTSTAPVTLDLSRPSNLLEVKVEEGAVKQVSWNGESLHELTNTKTNTSAKFGAGYGLYNAKGRTRFHRTRLN